MNKELNKEEIIEKLEESIDEIETLIKKGVMDKDAIIYKVRNDLCQLRNVIELGGIKK
jgi:aconitase B